MPGHSLIGSVATLDSSRVTCPEKPASMKPAVECVSRPSRPSELLWVGMYRSPARNSPSASVDLDAADRDRGDRTCGDDRRGGRALRESVFRRASLRASRNTGNRGVNFTWKAGTAVDAVQHRALLALHRPQTEARCQLGDGVAELLSHVDELAAPDRRRRSRPSPSALGAGRAAAHALLTMYSLGQVLVAQQAHAAQRARERTVGDVVPGRIASAADGATARARRSARPWGSTPARPGSRPPRSGAAPPCPRRAGDLGLRRRAVTQPDAEDIGVDRQVPVRVVDRCGQADVVVAPRSRTRRLAAICAVVRTLDPRRPCSRSALDVVSHWCEASATSDRVVGELDLVARPVGHDLGRGHHPSRLAVGTEHLVADAQGAHRASSRRVGIGVEIASALPSSRADTSSGRETTS